MYKMCVFHQQNTSYRCEVRGKYFINLLDKCNDINLAIMNLHTLAAVPEKPYSVEILSNSISLVGRETAWRLRLSVSSTIGCFDWC